MPDVVGIGHDVFGEAPVHRVTGVLLLFAQRLPAAQTVSAMAAGGVEPRHADAIAFLHLRDTRAYSGDMADALVTRDEGGFGLTGQSPSAACRSVWQTPLAAIFTRIWPAPGVGTGTSWIEKRLFECAHYCGFHGPCHGITSRGWRSWLAAAHARGQREADAVARHGATAI